MWGCIMACRGGGVTQSAALQCRGAPGRRLVLPTLMDGGVSLNHYRAEDSLVTINGVNE